MLISFFLQNPHLVILSTNNPDRIALTDTKIVCDNEDHTGVGGGVSPAAASQYYNRNEKSNNRCDRPFESLNIQMNYICSI